MGQTHLLWLQGEAPLNKIQGSVVESPVGQRERSEHLPGACVPVPYPKLQKLSGSLNVIHFLTLNKTRYLIWRHEARKFVEFSALFGE